MNVERTLTLDAAQEVRALLLSLPKAAWRNVTWREATGGRLTSRFARLRVRAARWPSELPLNLKADVDPRLRSVFHRGLQNFLGTGNRCSDRNRDSSNAESLTLAQGLKKSSGRRVSS